MTVCEHCGAVVSGTVCEYCDMPIRTKPAPAKVIYKNKPKITMKLSAIKNRKKLLRAVLAGSAVFFAVSITAMAVSANRNRGGYIYSPADYAVEYHDGYDDYDHYDHHDYYDIEEAMPVYSANEAFSENGVFPSGTYQIGVDIPEGLYVFIPDMADGHGVEGVYADPECENQISSAYVHFDGSRIAEISGNGYLDFSWATAYNLDMHPEIINDPYSSDGMFIVGRDIPAGTYTLEPYGEYGEYAEWYTYSSINAVGAVLKESGELTSYDDYTQSASEITINDGEYLELRDCIISNG
ncbi:MAG: hypothetical protein NC177_08170 [Ruminococcus flavefaciens]|nr:hypothetical protein [Ruminococcus flavefaciens]